MNREEFIFLQTPAARRTIEQYIGEDPVSVALKVRNPALATQIKMLAKSARKLPSYHAARCIIPTVSYEQSSSEAAALSKDFPGGELAIDLTCGLGVDSLALSRRYGKVISIEKDPLRADIARYNFGLLGASNIEVVCTGAEEFCAGYTGAKADLIYIDPARRDSAGKNVYSLTESSPNVLELLDRMREISVKQAIKLSPLFDVQEGFRLFGEQAAVEVVSAGGECKEVVVRLGFDAGKVINTVVGADGVNRYIFGMRDIGRQGATREVSAVDPAYILVPDVVFYKSRTVDALLESLDTYASLAGGYISSQVIIPDFPGKTYRIEEVHPYRPKELIKLLKQRAVRQADIQSRTQDYSAVRIAEALKIRIGGSQQLFFAEYAGELSVFFVNRIG